MALPFIPSDAALLGLQAGVVAAPRVAPRVELLDRFQSRAWALVPIASIVLVIFAIRYVSDTATGLTYLALVAVPLLAAAALGWAARGARPLLALLAIPLFVIAWVWRTSLSGEAAAALLSALSCVTLGVLLAAVTPPGWLKVGIVLMAIADTLAGRVGPASGPERDADRGAPGGEPAEPPERAVRDRLDGLRRPVRGGAAGRRAGGAAAQPGRRRAAHVRDWRPYSTCCSSSSTSCRRRFRWR